MIAPISLTIYGTPRPQQRARFIKGRVVSYTDKKLDIWRKAIERACGNAVAARGGG